MRAVPETKRAFNPGSRFTRLTIIGVPFFVEVGRKGMRHQFAVAECDCGHVVAVNCNNVKRGLTGSCGCLNRQINSALRKVDAVRHGGSRTDLYHVWQSMRARCENADHRFFYRYGGRGIAVCAEWATFEPFRDWANANGYQPGLSIDRIDNDGGYSPDNCRWITQSENTKKMHRDKAARN